MSLKAFHIVFIIFSTLLALGTGVWCLWVNLVEGAPIYVAGAAAKWLYLSALMGFDPVRRQGEFLERFLVVLRPDDDEVD